MPIDFIAPAVEQAGVSPYPVLVVEASSGQTVGVGDDRGEVSNVVRGVVALRDQDVAQNERGSAIAHREELTANDLNSFLVLDVVVIRQRTIIRLEPVARTVSGGIAVDVSAVEPCPTRAMMVMAQCFDLGGEEFSDPLRDIGFARWRGGVVLREQAANESLFTHLPPSLRNPASAPQRLRNQCLGLFLGQLRRGSPSVPLSSICNGSRNPTTGNPSLDLAIKLKSDALGGLSKEGRVLPEEANQAAFDQSCLSAAFDLALEMFEGVDPKAIFLQSGRRNRILERRDQLP